MTEPMRHRAAPLVENMAESAAACLVTMVQGNLLALSVAHWLIASRTGLFAGAIATAAIVLSKTRNRWVVAGVLAVVTAGVDYVVHPAQFGAGATEAVITGAGAGVLSLGVAALWHRLRKRPTPTP